MDQPCKVCGTVFPVNRMDLLEDGYRCFRCSQKAEIQASEVERAHAIDSHNRTVLAFSGLRFWRLEFHCSECNQELPRGPGVFSVARPPVSLRCGKCGATMALSLTQRASWMFSIIFRLAFVAVAIARWSSFPRAFAAGTAVAVIEAVLVPLVIGFVAAIVLAVPAALLLSKPS
jgi:hypothetical protein